MLRAAAVLGLVALLGATTALASDPDVVKRVCTGGDLSTGACVDALLIDSGTAFHVALTWDDEVVTSFSVDAAPEATAAEHCGVAHGCSFCVVTNEVVFGATQSRYCLAVLYFDVAVDRTQLPVLPDAFTAVLEANMKELNQTLEMREFYDRAAGLVRQELHSDETPVVHLTDVGAGAFAEIVGDACEVRRLNETAGAHMLDRSSGRLRSARDMFESFAEGGGVVYAGNSTARGIPTDYWRGEVNTTFQSHRGAGGTVGLFYTLDWHFAVPSWRWRHASDHRLPVRAVLTGAMYNLTASGGAWSEAHARPFEHVYEWVAFTPGRPDPEVMRVPETVDCAALEPREVPRGSEDFRAAIEYTNTRLGRTQSTIEWYDYDGQRVRYERGKNEAGREQVDLVDYAAGTAYEVEYGADGGVAACKLTKVPPEYEWEYDSAAHHLRRMSPGYTASPFTGAVPEFRYVGRRHARGIECDAWVARYTNVNMEVSGGFLNLNFTHTLHYATSEWSLQGFSGREDRVLPVLGVMAGTARYPNTAQSVEFRDEVHYLDVDYREAPEDAFAVPSACPHPDGAAKAGGLTGSGAAGLSVAMTVIGAIIGSILYHRTSNKRHFSLANSRSTTSDMSLAAH